MQLKTSWAGNLTDEIPESQVFSQEMNNCTVYGKKATVRQKPLTLFQDVNGQFVDRALEPQDKADSFELQMQNFIDAIRGIAASINNAQRALYLMEMLDAIYLSSSSQREVRIAQA